MQNSLTESLKGHPQSDADLKEMHVDYKESIQPGIDKKVYRSFGLDFARSMAICLVLFAHFAHKSLDALGFWGVELFFGLSGFLIGQILWKDFSQAKEWTFKNIFNFWSRRWWRTLPNYYLFLLLMLVFSYFVEGGLPSLSIFSRFLWFGQDLLNGQYGFFPVSWSLCVEEWFYLTFPIVLFAISKTGLSAKTSFLCTLLIFFLFSVIVREVLINSSGAPVIRITTFARLDSIACGVSTAYFTLLMKPGYITKWIIFLAGVLLCVQPLLSIYFYGNTNEQMMENPWYLLSTPLGFSLMLPLISLLQAPKKIFGFVSTAIQKLSLWSYSIYLSHLPMMWLVYHLTANFRSTVYGNFISKLVGLAATIMISAFLFKFFEEPFTRKRPAALKS